MRRKTGEERTNARRRHDDHDVDAATKATAGRRGRIEGEKSKKLDFEGKLQLGLMGQHRLLPQRRERKGERERERKNICHRGSVKLHRAFHPTSFSLAFLSVFPG
jgi:hypothetical protein